MRRRDWLYTGKILGIFIEKDSKYKEINRRPSMEEIHEVKNYANDLGILYEPVS